MPTLALCLMKTCFSCCPAVCVSVHLAAMDKPLQMSGNTYNDSWGSCLLLKHLTHTHGDNAFHTWNGKYSTTTRKTQAIHRVLTVQLENMLSIPWLVELNWVTLSKTWRLGLMSRLKLSGLNPGGWINWTFQLRYNAELCHYGLNPAQGVFAYK